MTITKEEMDQIRAAISRIRLAKRCHLRRQAYGFRDMASFKLRVNHIHSQAYSLTG